MNRPALALEPRQTQTLTPRLQQAVRLLQLSTFDFALELQELVSSNPFLELEDGEHADDDAAAAGAASTELDASPPEGEGGAPAEDYAETAYEERLNDGGEAPGRYSEANADAIDFACAPVTLRQHVHSQLNMLDLPSREHFLAWIVAEALDDDGYLRVELDALRAMAGLEPRVDAREMLAALTRVQSLDPAGVAARDVPECLTLQLRRRPPSPQRDLALRIVREELKLLQQRDLQRIAQRVGSTPAEVEAVCAYIRRLDPRPGACFGHDVAASIRPDVIVRKIRGQWTAHLNSSAVPRISLNRTYAELFQRHREPHHGDLAGHLREARWAVQNMEQRFSTILRVAQALVDRQQHFFEHGTLAMQPLGLKDIADELGLHESTVSRATCNKFMVTPFGVFELKYFFSRALNTEQGSQCSTTAIREAIRKMILSEDARSPHSDADIARILMQQGLRVARRTVTKYRQMMAIPNVDMRRYHG